MPEANSANPLLLGWVKEWYDAAKERNSKGVTTYKHAYDSLKACPITFEHPSQLQQLRGFGPKLCDRLTTLLKQHCQENGLPIPKVPPRKRKSDPSAQDGEEPDEERPAKKPRKTKAYVPVYRSGAYALIVALSALEDSATFGMPKTELIDVAQQHCDASFTAPSDPTKFYTAWSSMKTLQQKELVYERGRPLKRYCLTDEGWEVARRIKQTINTNDAIGIDALSESTARLDPGSARSTAGQNNHDSLFVTNDKADAAPSLQGLPNVDATDTAAPEASFQLPSFAAMRLSPGSFTVELVLDFREVRAKTDRDYMQNELSKMGVRPIMRSLELGDAMWVAKVKDPDLLRRHGAEGDEVVLDWIVERKRLDDLIGSIKDGRFHEQKFRLRRSGVRNVIYIIEEISMDANHYQRYEEAVQSAIASTQVINGYFVKRTQKMDDTIRYMAKMTEMLKKLYENKALHVIPTTALTDKNYLPMLKHLRETEPSTSYHISYTAFASLVSKSEMTTLRDVYLKMLMCTRGVTGEKAIEIQRRWRTPYDFVTAFQRCGSDEDGKRRKQNLVAGDMGSLVGRKKIAKALSKKIAEVWGDA
jgi:crossover junction endonuclease MUS81